MIVWLSLFILSAQSTAPMDHRYAETIFATDFEQSSDVNYDGWPDDWTGGGARDFHTTFVFRSRRILPDDSAQSRCLRIELDGGGATVYSPPIEISPQFSYMFQGKTEDPGIDSQRRLLHVSRFSIATRQQKELFTSEELTDVAEWQELQIGPLTPHNPEARLAVIGCTWSPPIAPISPVQPCSTISVSLGCRT